MKFFQIRPNLGFWKQLIDYEISLFGLNSVKIIASNIGPIPDVYENEVKNMQFGVQQPEPSINQKAAQSSQSSLSLNIPIDKLPGNNSLFPQVLKISPRQPAAKQGTKSNYTTTYNASYQKPF